MAAPFSVQIGCCNFVSVLQQDIASYLPSYYKFQKTRLHGLVEAAVVSYRYSIGLDEDIPHQLASQTLNQRECYYPACQQFQKTSQIASVASRAEIPVTIINLNCLKIPSTYSSTIHSKDGGKFHLLGEGGSRRGEDRSINMCTLWVDSLLFPSSTQQYIYTDQWNQWNNPHSVQTYLFPFCCSFAVWQFLFFFEWLRTCS